MILLPLLIKEKVKFYYDRECRQEWLEKIKIMHHQYKEKITHHGCDYEYIAWIHVVSHLEIEIRLFYRLDGTEHKNKKDIISFNKPYNKDGVECKLPQKYYYSSGLNNPLGYK